MFVWVCFSVSGDGSLMFIEGTMMADLYIDILLQRLCSSAKKIGIVHTFKFYQNNNPKHKVHKTREQLLYNCSRVLETPP